MKPPTACVPRRDPTICTSWSADPNSASGYLIPRAEFRAQGIDPESGKYFGRTGFAGGHEQTVVAVLNHQYDGGVTWTSGVGDPAVGYSRGALRMMVEPERVAPTATVVNEDTHTLTA